MKIVIVVPTRNEEATIGILLDRFTEKVFPALPRHELELVVVDDSTSKKTEEIVKGRALRHANIHFLRGKGRGLGPAVEQGFRYAIEALHADAVARIDGDLQHDPADLPRFIAALEEGNDYIIGSRLMPGGALPPKWAWYRTFLSRRGNRFIGAALGLHGIHDITSDYRIARVEGCLDQIQWDRMISRSVAHKIQLVADLARRGARIKEIPIQFLYRSAGKSTLSPRDVWESVRVVMVLWMRRRRT